MQASNDKDIVEYFNEGQVDSSFSHNIESERLISSSPCILPKRPSFSTSFPESIESLDSSDVFTINHPKHHESLSATDINTFVELNQPTPNFSSSFPSLSPLSTDLDVIRKPYLAHDSKYNIYQLNSSTLKSKLATGRKLGDIDGAGHTWHGKNKDISEIEESNSSLYGISEKSFRSSSSQSPSTSAGAIIDRESFDNTLVDPSKVDRYGFIIQNEEELEEGEKDAHMDQREKMLLRRENNRSMKWVRMMRRLEDVWMTDWSTKQKKFIHRLYKGIPNSLRHSIWSRMVRDMQIMDRGSTESRKSGDENPSYASLCEKYSIYERQIDLDVERTLRNHMLFRMRFGTGQSSLFRILIALANDHPDVGYCQGMSTVAAFFLLYFDEEQAFDLLRVLFEKQNLNDLYAHRFPKLFETFYVHELSLRHYYPKILRHLEKCGIATPIYATKWYLTLFLGLPYAVAARVWDLFLYFGFDVLIHAALALLHYFEDSYLKLDFEKTMQFLSRCEEQAIDPDRYIKILKITWSDSNQELSSYLPARLRAGYRFTNSGSMERRPGSPNST